jgi:chromosomal replication initiator protein
MDLQKIWQAVLGELEVTLSRANFTTWFKNTRLDGITGEVARVIVPNAFTKEWLQRKYLDEIVAAVAKHRTEVSKVEFKVGQARAEAPAPAATPRPEAPAGEEPVVSSLPKNSFENFVVGNSNRLAFATSKAVTNNLGGTYNPLFLYGGAGLGKTHLMQAIGRGVQLESGKKAFYVTAEKFTNDLVSAIQQSKTAAFKNRYRKADVLLVDDVQFLAGKSSIQEEFFHTFNALHQDGKQIVLSSDRPPKAIPTLEERLRSRFEWGMVADVSPPELETRTAILRFKAEERGYEVPAEVIDYIAKAIQQNIRELEGALIRVMAHAELTGTAPTAALAEQLLGNILSARGHRQVTTTQIIEAVAGFYDVSISDLKGPGRQKEVVKPRQLIMFLLREEANLSYPKIGRELGNRDHTTVIHAVGKIGQQSESDEPLRHELNLIKERLYA